MEERMDIPCFVVKKRYQSSAKSSTVITALTHSSLSICKTLIIGIPFAVRPNSGISKPRVRYTFPLLVKKSTVECVDADTKCSTKSSSCEIGRASCRERDKILERVGAT